jgi:hypothetical protein
MMRSSAYLIFAAPLSMVGAWQLRAADARHTKKWKRS